MARKDHFASGAGSESPFKIWDQPNTAKSSEEPREVVVPMIHTPAREAGTLGPDDAGFPVKWTNRIKIERGTTTKTSKIGDVGNVRIALRDPNTRTVESLANRGMTTTDPEALERQHPRQLGKTVGAPATDDEYMAGRDKYVADKLAWADQQKAAKKKQGSKAKRERRMALLPNEKPRKRTKRIEAPSVATKDYPQATIPNPRAKKPNEM
jgi:hypothetical protein